MPPLGRSGVRYGRYPARMPRRGSRRGTLKQPIIFTKDPADPRFFVRPGEAYRPYFTVPSRMTMWFIYVVIAGVGALVIFGFILAIMHG
jgi:hypothetical protein